MISDTHDISLNDQFEYCGWADDGPELIKKLVYDLPSVCYKTPVVWSYQ